MRLLLDTHVLLWWLEDSPSLCARAREAIKDETNVVSVSAVSAWEIAIKSAQGKLSAPNDLKLQLEANEFLPLPITVDDGLAAGSLPPHHGDPFDRMLIAQALAGGWTILTRDRRFSAYGVGILPA